MYISLVNKYNLYRELRWFC